MTRDIEQLSNRIYAELCFDKCKKHLCWNKENNELLILERPNFIEIDVFSPGCTIKEIYARLNTTLIRLMDGPRIKGSLTKYADFIQCHYSE